MAVILDGSVADGKAPPPRAPLHRSIGRIRRTNASFTLYERAVLDLEAAIQESARVTRQ
jgi:hypothetical protein